MFKIQHKKLAAFLFAVFIFFACSIFAQADSTGTGVPSESEVSSFLKVVMSVLSSFGVKIAPTWSAFIFLIIPIIWRWVLVKRLKRTIKANADIAAENKELPAGHGSDPVEHVGIFKKFINLFRKNK